MLSRIVSALTAFTTHVTFTLFPKFLQRLKQEDTVPDIGIPNFSGSGYPLLLHRLIHVSGPEITGYPENEARYSQIAYGSADISL